MEDETKLVEILPPEGIALSAQNYSFTLTF